MRCGSLAREVEVAAARGWGRARSPRARSSARARRARRPRAARAAAPRPAALANIDGRGLTRIAPLERAQPPARLRLPGIADEAVDGVGRDDGTRAFGERGGERREVDARLGEVEAQRHTARIPMRPALIAGGVSPSGTRGVCHLAASARLRRRDDSLDAAQVARDLDRLVAERREALRRTTAPGRRRPRRRGARRAAGTAWASVARRSRIARPSSRGVDRERRGLVAGDLGVDLVARGDVGRVRDDQVEAAARDRGEQVALQQLDPARPGRWPRRSRRPARARPARRRSRSRSRRAAARPGPARSRPCRCRRRRWLGASAPASSARQRSTRISVSGRGTRARASQRSSRP